MTVNELQDRVAKLDALIDPLMDWLSQLAKWRQQLSDELVDLLARSPHIRNPKTLGVKFNLEFSIRTTDNGTSVLAGSGYELTNLRLGELMRADGFEPVGADAARSFAGVMPWLGGEREVSRELKELNKRRDPLAKQLAEANLTDAERAERDAASEAYRDVLNSMRLKHSNDVQELGNGGYAAIGTYLVACAPDGRILDSAELTPAQRDALARANSQHTLS